MFILIYTPEISRRSCREQGLLGQARFSCLFFAVVAAVASVAVVAAVDVVAAADGSVVDDEEFVPSEFDGKSCP